MHEGIGQLCYVVDITGMPLPIFLPLFLRLSYFTSKDETLVKGYIFDIGYKLASQPVPTSYGKI